MEITTVADDLVVMHDGLSVQRHDGLSPDTDYTLSGMAVHTLPRPGGQLLCRCATVNDLHFGEVEAGRLDEQSRGPVLRVPDGAEAYLDVMNRAAVSETTGILDLAQIDWLDTICSESDAPMAMGHHQQWVGQAGGRRSDTYFGLHPDSSDLLDDVAVRRSNLIAYSAGHTHRHRVRSMTASGIPSIEIGCTKDFPGTWAEYRVFEGGVMQVVHRMSSPAALAWSEQCRHLYESDGVDYESYTLGSLGNRCVNISLR